MIGIDEVGRGAWAGPLLVVAARTMAKLPKGLTDSKTLTKTKREAYVTDIVASCDIGCGWVSNREIDTIGITHAMRLGVQRALNAIYAQYNELIVIDGTINYCDPVYSNVIIKIKADLTEPIVSAASIYAKVIRDRLMVDQAKHFPGYGFECHVGYGTEKHRSALEAFGVTEIHRLSYKPVKAYV